MRPLASKAVFGSAPPSSWSRSASGMRGVLRRAIGNLLGIHYGRPHTEIPTLPGSRAVDLAQINLHGCLHGARDLVQHVGGLVHPTPLMASAGIDLVEGLPKPKCAVADRDLGRDGQPAPFHLNQELTPALSAFPDADLEAHQLLPAVGC